MDINTFANEVHELAKTNGFHSGHDEDLYFEQMLGNLHDEISELHQAARLGILNSSCDKNIPLTNMEEELADIVIRALDLMMHYKINPYEVLWKKHNYNKTRPFKHGKLH